MLRATHHDESARPASAAEPRLSVVVITRNEAGTIGRCLESVLRAVEGHGAEVTLVDSASDDETVAIARRYPVRVIVLADGAPRRPAVGRHVGLLHARGDLVLFVDGDCVIDPAWLQPALDALASDSRLAGVAGASEAVLPHPPGADPQVEDQYPGVEYDAPRHLSGSALYRRAALDDVGGFNPFLHACEEIELGARLRRGGYRLRRLRIRMSQHFPKARKETVRELLRRFRHRYFVGLGQLARHTISHGLPLARPLREIDRHLAFFALLASGVVGGLAWLASGSPHLLLLSAVLMATLFVAFAIRTRSLDRPAYYFLEWSLASSMVVWGLLAAPRLPDAFPPVPLASEAGGGRGSRARRLRDVGLGTLLGIVAGVAALLVCELATRLIRPQLLYRYPKGLYAVAPLRGYRLTPGFRGELATAEYRTAFNVNGQGLREDREYGSKLAGTFRILVLGDSFTTGIGVESAATFEKLLERQLNAGGARRFEVVNGGVPGYGTREEAMYLKQEGLDLQPDLLVLAFFAGNDVTDNLRTVSATVRDGELATGQPDGIPGILPTSIRSVLARHSHLYHLALPSLRRLIGRDGWEIGERARNFAIYDRPEAPEIAPGWRATTRWLGRIARTARAHAVPLAAVIIPDPLQVDASAWQVRRDEIAPGSVRFDRHRPDEHVADLFARAGIPALDLLPRLEREPSAPYLPQDGHWTPRGHQIAADAIGAFLRDGGLLPVD